MPGEIERADLFLPSTVKAHVADLEILRCFRCVHSLVYTVKSSRGQCDPLLFNVWRRNRRHSYEKASETKRQCTETGGAEARMSSSGSFLVHAVLFRR